MTKRSRLRPFETRTRCPDFEWSGIQIPGTGPKSPFETRNGPGFGCLLYYLLLKKFEVVGLKDPVVGQVKGVEDGLDLGKVADQL